MKYYIVRDMYGRVVLRQTGLTLLIVAINTPIIQQNHVI